MTGEGDGDGAVVAARWACGEPADGIDATVRAVRAFARRHGMSAAGERAVARAVREALGVVLGGDDDTGALVDAATDGTWLSVWVTGPAGRATGVDADPAVALPLATAAADRVAWERASTATGAAAVLEFAIDAPPAGPRRAARSGRCATGRRRRAGRARTSRRSGRRPRCRGRS
jgi:hypothetical protein